MELNDKIYVAGHRGMVGGAILRALQERDYCRIMTRSHGELDLVDGPAVKDFFASERPAYVFLAAAKVGGILANERYGGDFIVENLQIQTHVIDAARCYGCRKLLFLGSSCIYPKHAAQPIAETSLLTGPLEPTNLPYAVAKIAGVTLCDAYRKQYGFDAFTAMPSNVYGIGDNFDAESGHVVAGLMDRIDRAHRAGAFELAAWGSGTPRRELIDADDVADACLFLMNHYDSGGLINIGSSEEVTIRVLADKIAGLVGYRGRIVWDRSKPDGTPRKIMDNSKIAALGWRASTSLDSGLEKMYRWYCSNHREI